MNAKPILLVRLNYDLEKLQAELIETDLKVKLEYQYHVLLITGVVNQREPFKIEVLNPGEEEFDTEEFKKFISHLISEADKALIESLKKRISSLSDTVKNLSGYIDSIGKTEEYQETKLKTIEEIEERFFGNNSKTQA